MGRRLPFWEPPLKSDLFDKEMVDSMDAEMVLERLRLLTEDPREELLRQLSADAAKALEAKLRCTGEEAAKNEASLVTAAAAEAAYRLALLDGAFSPESVTAGDVRTDYGSKNAENAKAYRDACFAALGGLGLVEDDGFRFRGVRTW